MTSSASTTHWVSRTSSNELGESIQEKRPLGRFFFAKIFQDLCCWPPLNLAGRAVVFSEQRRTGETQCTIWSFVVD